MAYIRQIGEDEATGALRRVYEAARARAGGVANIIRIMSQDGRSAQGSMQFYVSLMKAHNALPAPQREMLATVVSNINACYYWTLSHAMDFGRESGNHPLAEQLIFDYRQAGLTAADRALCDYAVKLTLAPDRMTERDIETLRSHGFDDAAITIAVQVISYFNYINRIADGLAVDDEAGWTVSREQWDRHRGRDYGGTETC